MRNILFVAIAACASLAYAQSAPGGHHHHGLQGGNVHVKQDGTANGTLSNHTHFVDHGTGQVYRHFNCDSHLHNASDHFRQTVENLHNPQYKGGHPTRAHYERRMNAAIPPINVYAHVITKVASKGSISQQMVTNQIAAMNTAYKPAGVSFVLKGTDFTANDNWAVAGDSTTMTQLKTALRKGTYSTLNLYFHTDLSGGILGTCTLPSQVSAGMSPSMYVSDGCNVQANTMPGGTVLGYNKGQTAVHETGHWLGLLHTFEGYSCSGSGDYISDTDSESTSTDGCPSTKNTCSTSGGDPVHNYMDYSSDDCYNQFTAGQITRMKNMWAQYRNGM